VTTKARPVDDSRYGGSNPSDTREWQPYVSAATHSALVAESRVLDARARELQLVRKNRAEADPLLMESWLNDALTSKDQDSNFDEPPVVGLYTFNPVYP
jgi:hypothetical protein